MKYLITQSLLSAWQYMYDCYEERSEEARESFLKTLNREPQEASKAMLKGIAFEDLVNAVLKESDIYKPIERYKKEWKASEAEINTALIIAKNVAGGVYQLTAYKDARIAGLDFLLMAKCDWVKRGVIYDCKRVENYEEGKYLNSPQHPMYLEVVDGVREFKYLVSDGEHLYEESYTRTTTAQSIHTLIEEFVEDMTAQGLLELYKEKWKAR